MHRSRRCTGEARLAQLLLQAFQGIHAIFKRKHGKVVISEERTALITGWGVGVGERMVCNVLPLPLVALPTIYICHKNRNKIIYYFCN
jgi:hypothetical protein